MIIARAICLSFLFTLGFRAIGVWIPLTESPAFASDVYEWVDSKDVQHFSDTPPEQAGKISGVKTLTLPNSEPVPSTHQYYETGSSLVSTSSSTDQLGQATVKIKTPSNYETIRNNLGLITIQAEVNPSLVDNQQLQLMLDYLPYNKPQSDQSWQLENIDRGAHYFSIDIVESGKIIASSDPITVYLHRAKIK